MSQEDNVELLENAEPPGPEDFDEADGDGGKGNLSVLEMEAFDPGSGSAGISAFAQRAYLAYAMSVVKGRALPFIEDGQKPVQRRILFAMKELGNWHNSSYKKSARIVGDVIGKYHPHGDSSVYEAAVRMAQDFTLRYPLIEGQGNFGSRDGDTAAAMRYTEIRLSKFAEEILLTDIDRGTVDFSSNYDESLSEPKLLPARLPLVLLNGATGIAVGMATDIPPHNLREVSEAACGILLKMNAGLSMSDDEILDVIRGPDFAGGSHVISSPSDIRKTYLEGRGSLRVRAKWAVEPLAKGQWQIAITELPPCSFDAKDLGDRKVTGAARILAEIDEMLAPKFEKGKKLLTPKQQNLKSSLLGLLDKARDDSDKAHPIRIVLEPKSSKVSPDELMAVLMANTALEGNVKVNLVSIGMDGKPLQKSVPSILREWTVFRMLVLERRLKYRLDEIVRRLHILDGRMIAFLNIDQVIQVIRTSDEPKPSLMQNFNLSDVQAEDILEIRLRQLARLEGIKIETEIKRLSQEKSEIEHLLGSDVARREHLVSEIQADTAKYGDERRTLIQEAERITLSKVDITVDEPVTILLSKNGFIRSRSGHGIDINTLTWKPGDAALKIIETRSTLPIVLLDGVGKTYTLKSMDIPGGKGDGIPVTSLIDTGGARILFMICGAPDCQVMISSTNGYGFICQMGDMVSRQKSGKRFLSLEGDDAPNEPYLVGDRNKFVAISSASKTVVFDLEEVKIRDGGKGVMLISLEPNQTMAYGVPFKDSVMIRGHLKNGKVMDFEISADNISTWFGKRGRKGYNLPVSFSSIESVE